MQTNPAIERHLPIYANWIAKLVLVSSLNLFIKWGVSLI